jgi:hypothetical protein
MCFEVALAYADILTIGNKINCIIVCNFPVSNKIATTI